MMADSGQQYVRLAGEAEADDSPRSQTATRSFFFSNRTYNHIPRATDQLNGDSDSEIEGQHVPQSPHMASSPALQVPWWQRLAARRHPPPQPPPQSDYLTLIPLSDSRLKPPRTRLIVSSLLILAVLAVSAVFVLVPRGVTVGTIQVHSSQISFNTSKSTYQILLTATIPVYNPNYLSVQLSGMVNVSFYDQQAGYTVVPSTRVAAGANPQVVSVDMDASSVPQKYLFTIYTQCFTFPEQLIFFLTGNLQAVHYTGQVIKLPLIDNYFIISCNQSDKGGDEGDGKRNKTGKGEGKHKHDSGGPGADTHADGLVDSSGGQHTQLSAAASALGTTGRSGMVVRMVSQASQSQLEVLGNGHGLLEGASSQQGQVHQAGHHLRGMEVQTQTGREQSGVADRHSDGGDAGGGRVGPVLGSRGALDSLSGQLQDGDQFRDDYDGLSHGGV